MRDATILVVEDDDELREAVQLKLESAGYSTVTAADGQQALDAFNAQQDKPDLVLLDIMLPDIDGTAICQQIRQGSSVPIIMLTARSEEVDRILGLELGADDYITKPFSLSELVARVKAVLRRADAQAAVTADTVLEAAGVALDLRSREVTVDGEPVKLTPTQMRLLQVLMEQAGRVLSVDDILEAVWEYDQYDSHLVETHIYGGGSRIETGSGSPERIITVPSFGYKFATESNPPLRQATA